MIRAAFATALVLSTTRAPAQEPRLVTPDLPGVAAVERALSAYPPVAEARTGIVYEQTNERRLAAGPYEFALRGGYQSHNIPTGRLPEWDIGVERPIRLPGKRRQDEALGQQGVGLARLVAYSAWCDGARHMLKLWFGWARENVQLELWRQQADALRQQQAVVIKRAKLGDAPRAEVNLAAAATAQAEAVVANFQGREEGALGALAWTFPSLPMPRGALLAEPKPLEGSLDFFVERIRVHNDEVRVARAATKRRQMLAERAISERTPDPAVGVRYGTDRSTTDHIASLYFIIPLAGDSRRAAADGAAAQSTMAASHEAAVLQRVTAEVATMHGQARGAYAGWIRARAAAEGMKRNADLTTRSWQLKEASLSDVMQARRLAIESALAAALAQIDAGESRYRLLVEAHLLWNDPEEEREEHSE